MKVRGWWLLGALLAGSMLASCASNGRQIDQANVDTIVKGQTTKAEMMKTFGPPLSQAFDSSGKLMMTWFYVHVGPFGSGMQQQNLTVLFDQNEVVEKYSMVNSGPSDGVRLGK